MDGMVQTLTCREVLDEDGHLVYVSSHMPQRQSFQDWKKKNRWAEETL